MERAERANVNISRLAEDALRKVLDLSRPITAKEHLQRILEEAGRSGSLFEDVCFLPLQIASLRLDNVGPFKKLETSFIRDRVNLIYGAGGSGKSTILRSILLAFGRRHRFFSERATKDGKIRLELFPDQPSPNIIHIESSNITKGYQCLLADGLFSRLARKMVVPLFNELNNLDIQIIITSSLSLDVDILPKNAHVISLEDFSHYRQPHA